MRYAAERGNLDGAIEELRQIADGRNDILAEVAGVIPPNEIPTTCPEPSPRLSMRPAVSAAIWASV